MQVTFLGTSSGVPTRARNVSAVALRLSQRSEMWLFDCGEGTQHQFLRSDLRLSQLRRVFITHMHGDHVFGLPGLLASLLQMLSALLALASLLAVDVVGVSRFRVLLLRSLQLMAAFAQRRPQVAELTREVLMHQQQSHRCFANGPSSCQSSCG